MQDSHQSDAYLLCQVMDTSPWAAATVGLSNYSGFGKLDETKREIRLLTISGDSTINMTGEAIKCFLHRVPLEDANPFYALSYVWGDVGKTAPICLDGEAIHVRHNLWLFLQALRNHFCASSSGGPSQTKTIRVWLDYVCINQEDGAERNFQVSMMGDIFQSADAVYSWLGPPTTESDRVLSCIDAIKNLRAQNRTWASISKEKQGELETIQDVVQRSYWTRLWIKQEVILAKDVWFFCGDRVTNWKDMQFGISLASGSSRKPLRQRNSVERNQASETGRQNVNSLLQSRSNTWTKASLSQLVAKFRNAGCQDGRDRIYGLLSLVDDETSNAIKVDYEKPLLQVLLETYALWTGENVQTLTALGLGTSPVFQYESFCAQILSLLSNEDLQSLWVSQTQRQKILTKVLFRTLPPRAAEIDVIGTMDHDKVVPYNDISSLKPGPRGMVTQIQLQGLRQFVYTWDVPHSGDLVANLGSHVFFFRYHFPDKADAVHHRGYTYIAAKGMAVNTVANGSSLRSLQLPNPCQWLQEQLEDAGFEWVGSKDAVFDDQGRPHSEAQYHRRVILCNGAAVVTLLREARQYVGPDGPLQHEGRFPGSDFDISVGPRDEKDTDGLYWSPWQFGLEYRTLQPCKFCKTEGMMPPRSRLQQIKKRQTAADTGESSCSCTWTR